MRNQLTTRSYGRFALLLSLNVVLAGAGAWMWHNSRKNPNPHKGLVYSSQGYGGWVGESHAPVPDAKTDPVLLARTAYVEGEYPKAEAEAEKVIRAFEGKQDDASQREVALAERIEAYSAAKRKDFATAKERFGYMRDTAAHLKDRGAIQGVPGEPMPTLEEEGAFQRAVCTSGMGEKTEAEAEFEQFMQHYPQSVLVHAAVKRIGRYHGGDTPKEAEKIWKEAMALQKSADRAKQREESLCGPQCLAELLRRKGRTVNIESLAKEMGTNEEGTSIDRLIGVFERHGYKAQGFRMTLAGLEKQSFPAVALLSPGHYVIVERISAEGVQVWDGDANPKETVVPRSKWATLWSGIAATLK